MKVFMITFGRPFKAGVKPAIYYRRPNVEHDVPDHECNPWCKEVIDFDSELKARRFFKDLYPELYDDLRVIR